MHFWTHSFNPNRGRSYQSEAQKMSPKQNTPLLPYTWIYIFVSFEVDWGILTPQR